MASIMPFLKGAYKGFSWLHLFVSDMHQLGFTVQSKQSKLRKRLLRALVRPKELFKLFTANKSDLCLLVHTKSMSSCQPFNKRTRAGSGISGQSQEPPPLWGHLRRTDVSVAQWDRGGSSCPRPALLFTATYTLASGVVPRLTVASYYSTIVVIFPL